MIRTRIAHILGPTRIVLAAGSEQGIKEGMEFIIYELSDPIFDPETNECLGELELHKGRVKALHVQERLATATTFRPDVCYPWWGSTRTSYALFRSNWSNDHEKLQIDESQATAVKVDLTVKVGDLVRSLD